MVNTKLTKAKPGHRCSLCGKRYPTEDEWKEHTIRCARDLREELAFECDYATKRERDLKRHTENQHKSNRRERTDGSEVDDLGRDPGDLHDLIGLDSPSRKPAAAEGKKKREKADDFPVFDPPRKVSRTTQGNAPGSSKTPSKSPTGDHRKQTCADKDKRLT